MLSGVMEHFGLSKSIAQAQGFETDHHRQVLKDLKVALYEGGIHMPLIVAGPGIARGQVRELYGADPNAVIDRVRVELAVEALKRAARGMLAREHGEVVRASQVGLRERALVPGRIRARGPQNWL